MLDQATGPWKLVLTVLFFPLFFQNTFLSFAWGVGDHGWMIWLKRIYLLLPVLAIVLGCWITSVSVATVIIRHRRSEFITSLLITWWDLAKAILAFWVGTGKFVFVLIGALFGMLRMLIIGLWVLVQDILLIPFFLIRGVGVSMLSPGVAWIAVALTLVWSFVEAAVFTYVTTPLVMDTLSNLTGDQLSESVIRVPLYLFMVFIILGSYAVLATWADAIRSKNIATIVKIGAIELVTIFVEVLFLYREFVDSLVPWFAQHMQGGFQLGIVGTLAISSLAWLGIRGMSWFLFAAKGAPTIMAIIQGEGIKSTSSSSQSNKSAKALVLTLGMIEQIKKEMDWIEKKGNDVLAAFILPPLQVVAAAINFCTLLIISQHIFEIPLKEIRDVMEPKFPIRIAKKGIKGSAA
ncbi:hypothetical protein K2X30_15240 [bacterium]|nr:hypothetical protein [bacterium]